MIFTDSEHNPLKQILEILDEMPRGGNAEVLEKYYNMLKAHFLAGGVMVESYEELAEVLAVLAHTIEEHN